ncbi:MAG: DUF1553 domain-containing protein [Planctomycetes bacterium]|nr:DUF1553 domain-containing protein [Planctomycetota bacterium]
MPRNHASLFTLLSMFALGSPCTLRAQVAAHPIDRLLERRLTERGLAFSSVADEVTLVRRAYWTLTGLPPEPEALERWLSCGAPDGYERLVDALLASPRFGEHVARRWLDVVHYAETDGFETNVPRANAYVYRDWVIEALNADMPYPTFLRRQIAGDRIGDDRATGFLVTGPHDEVKSPDARLTAEQRSNELADIVGTVGMTFLGTTLGCARCHDHKFDPIRQEDYYAVEAIFAGVQHGERGLPVQDEEARRGRIASLRAELDERLARRDAEAPLASSDGTPRPARPPVDALRNVERFEPVFASALRFVIEETSAHIEPCIDELEVFTAPVAEAPPRNVALRDAGARIVVSSALQGYAIHRPEHLNDGRIGNDWSWISGERGTGVVTVRFAQPERIERVVWARDRTGRYRDRLATRYRIEVLVDSNTWCTVASSLDRAPVGTPSASATVDPTIERLRAELERSSAKPRGYVGTFTQPGPTRFLFRGDPMEPRQVVSPNVPRALGALTLGDDAPEGDRRLAFANWLSAPERRRVMRVLANRVWQWVFGTGLVTTPNDHGRAGVAPTHPALLEFLTDELVASGGSIKRLVRLLVTSHAFRQSARTREDGMRLDGANTLLWRFPTRRVSAEMLRDGILQTAGVLDTAMYGPSFALFEPNDNYVRVYEPRVVFTAAEFRRMVYAQCVRMEKDDVFGPFDCPDGAQSIPVRARSTTPLQALNLRNARFVRDLSFWFARGVRRVAGDDVRQQVVAAFRIAFSRAPEDEELEAALPFVERHGLEALCRVLWNANEFVFIP